MTTRRAWTLCAVAGVVAFVATFVMGRVPGLKPCGPTMLSNAILAFEFARSPADLNLLFGVEPCRSTLIAAQRIDLLLDGLWFIPAYTAFLSLAALASGVAWRRWLVGALLVAGLSDQVEGLILWALLGALPGTQGLLDALWAAVHLKFALLAVGTAAIGVAAQGPAWWQRLAGTVMIGGGCYAAASLILAKHGQMMVGFSLGWFSLLALAMIFAALPSASEDSADPRRGPAPPAA